MMIQPPTIVPFAGCFARHPDEQNKAQLVFAGLPNDAQSSYRFGSRNAPARIRLAYDGNCYNSTTEAGVDLFNQVVDLGDLPGQSDWEKTAQNYREFARALFRAGKIPFFAGGDHAVTIALGEALAALENHVHIIQLDAHPDLYPEFAGHRFSHACTASRLLEMDHIASVTQIGIRTMNTAQAEQAKRFSGRLHVFHARDLRADLPLLLHIPTGAPVYLTVDLDAFDPAFAPGVAHPVPGGLAPRPALSFIQNAAWKLVGMDVVEVNPELDVNDQTAILAARLLHEGMGYAFSGRSKP